MLSCKTKRQYLLAFQVISCCLLCLHGRMRVASHRPQRLIWPTPYVCLPSLAECWTDVRDGGQHSANDVRRLMVAAGSQQTRHIYPMFDQCWPTVYDVGPTLVKHWIEVSCLLQDTASGASVCNNNQNWRQRRSFANAAMTNLLHFSDAITLGC